MRVEAEVCKTLTAGSIRADASDMDWFAKSEKDRVRTEQRDRTDPHRERRGFAFIAAAFDAHRCISTVDRCRFTEERNTVGSRARRRLDLFYAGGGRTP